MSHIFRNEHGGALSLPAIVNYTLGSENVFVKDKPTTTSSWGAPELSIRQLIYAALDGQTSWAAGANQSQIPRPFHCTDLPHAFLRRAAEWRRLSRTYKLELDASVREGIRLSPHLDSDRRILDASHRYFAQVMQGEEPFEPFCYELLGLAFPNFQEARQSLPETNVIEEEDDEAGEFVGEGEKVSGEMTIYRQRTKGCSVDIELDPTNVEWWYHAEMLSNQNRCNDAWWLRLDPWQRAAADLSDRSRITLIVGGPGCGRCWGRGTKLRMWNGELKSVEDIRAGDRLVGDDGQPRLVQTGSVRRGHTAIDETIFKRRRMMRGGCGGGGGERDYDDTQPEPATWRIDSHDKSRSSWTCNSAHVLVLRFDVPPTPIVSHTSNHYSFTHLNLTHEGPHTGRPFEETLSFTNLTSALKQRSALLEKYTPIVWECEVYQFLKLPSTLQRVAHMFQPRVTSFQTSNETLYQRIKRIITRKGPVTMMMRNERMDHTNIMRHARQIGRWIARRMQHDRFDEETFSDITLELIRTYHLDESSNSTECRRRRRRRRTFPLELLRDSPDVRRSVLDGFIAAADFDATSRHLLLYGDSCLVGFTEFARSLGFDVRVHGDSSSSPIRVELIEPSLKHTKEKDDDVTKYFFTITRIEHAEYFGFTLDGNGRCLMEDFTITHNVRRQHTHIARAHIGW